MHRRWLSILVTPGLGDNNCVTMGDNIVLITVGSGSLT